MLSYSTRPPFTFQTAFKNTREKKEDLEDVMNREVIPSSPPQLSNLTTVLVYRRKDSCYFAEYNQIDATFHNFFISVRRTTCFRRFFRPSSGAQNYTYSVRHLSDLPLARLAAGSSIGLTNA